MAVSQFQTAETNAAAVSWRGPKVTRASSENAGQDSTGDAPKSRFSQYVTAFYNSRNTLLTSGFSLGNQPLNTESGQTGSGLVLDRSKGLAAYAFSQRTFSRAFGDHLPSGAYFNEVV